MGKNENFSFSLAFYRIKTYIKNVHKNLTNLTSIYVVLKLCTQCFNCCLKHDGAVIFLKKKKEKLFFIKIEEKAEDKELKKKKKNNFFFISSIDERISKKMQPC